MMIAVTGADGQLGAELCRQLGSDAIPMSHSIMDVTSADQVDRLLEQWKPDAVINTAAFTNVDAAESMPEEAYAVNAQAVQHLAAACTRLDCSLVQVSTDHVFGSDITRNTPYTEDDEPNPLSVYGKTKREGERFAEQAPRHCIIRTCGLYSTVDVKTPPRHFVEKMLRLAKEHPTLQIVDDQICTPSYVPDVASAILFLARSSALGTFHVTNLGETSWFEFAQEIFHLSEVSISLQRVTTEHYVASRSPATIASRPLYSVLGSSRWEKLSGPTLPHWKVALAKCLGQ